MDRLPGPCSSLNVFPSLRLQGVSMVFNPIKLDKQARPSTTTITGNNFDPWWFFCSLHIMHGPLQYVPSTLMLTCLHAPQDSSTISTFTADSIMSCVQKPWITDESPGHRFCAIPTHHLHRYQWTTMIILLSHPNCFFARQARAGNNLCNTSYILSYLSTLDLTGSKSAKMIAFVQSK